MIAIRCCHTLEGAEPHRAAINALNLASARPDPFSTFEFYEHVVREAARFPADGGLQPWLLLAFSGEELVGYAALKASRRRVLGARAVKVDWLTGYEADRPHLVVKAGQGEAVARAIHEHLVARSSEWSLLEFQQQEDDSLLASALQAPPPGFEARHWPNPENGTIELNWRSTADYYAALSHKARANLRRSVRQLLAAGRTQLLTSDDPQAVPTLFALYRSVERHSWKSAARTSLGCRRESLDFYTGLMAPGQPMRLTIQVLLLDGAPIAGLISGAFAGGLYALHIAYDQRQSHLAPGTALLLMGVRYAIEGGFRRLNLLRGSGYYKTRWLAQLSQTRSLQLYRLHSPYWWRRKLGDAWRRARAVFARHEAKLLFNPARRRTLATTAAPMSAEERSGHAALVARALSARGEFLSGAELAAAMPFETWRASG